MKPSSPQTEIENLIGKNVERKAPAKDYTNGRRGVIVEVSGDRYRVRWLQERDGSPITTMGAKPENGVRTWVNKKGIILRDL